MMKNLKTIIASIFNSATLKSLKSKDFTFTLFMLIILFIIIFGLLLKIPFFKLFIYFYVFLSMLYMLNVLVGSNKYLDKILSKSNIIIRLAVPILIFLLLDYNKVLVVFTKFLLILAIRFCFSDKLTINTVVYFFFFCLASTYIYPIISVCLYEYSILRMNPENSNEHNLPEWYIRAQQEQDFREHQKNLQNMLKNTAHGTNYKELVPSDVNDFNIAKANNACEALNKDLRGFYGHVKVAGIASEISQKIINGELSNQDSPVHSKLTYEQLAVLKFFGMRVNMQNAPGLNGIVQSAPFTNTEPFKIEISGTISSNSNFGSRILNEIANHKNSVKSQIAETNNKTYIVD